MESNMHLETILWLNKQIDDIHAQSVLVGELLMDEDDPRIVEKYDKKLAELEKELNSINNKIELEKKLLAGIL
jgi:tRNA A22 N-methylase